MPLAKAERVEKKYLSHHFHLLIILFYQRMKKMFADDFRDVFSPAHLRTSVTSVDHLNLSKDRKDEKDEEKKQKKVSQETSTLETSTLLVLARDKKTFFNLKVGDFVYEMIL